MRVYGTTTQASADWFELIQPIFHAFESPIIYHPYSLQCFQPQLHVFHTLFDRLPNLMLVVKSLLENECRLPEADDMAADLPVCTG